MTTDTGPSRPTGSAIVERVPLVPIGTRRVEATLASMVSVFGLLFAVLTVPAAVMQLPAAGSAVSTVLAVLVYLAVLVAAAAALLHLWARTLFWVAGLVYLLALACWPVAAASGAGLVDGARPWLFQLGGVACAFVIVASGRRTALVYLVVVALSIALLRVTPAGGAVPLPTAALDGAYALVLAVALFFVAGAVRVAASRVDRAQSAALGKYADAQIDEATESERVRTDALVHDSVLTTFLSAAAAFTPDTRVLAAQMAQNAMNVLSRATVASHVGPKVRIADLPARIRADAAGIGDRFAFSTGDVEEQFVPETVADAIVSATVQAMTNSVKHAGGPEVARSLTIRGTGEGGVRVRVVDEGRGFDPALVASERLGLRVSILERMSRVGGEVDLRTAPGAGTSFVLSWPASAQLPVEPELAESAVHA